MTYLCPVCLNRGCTYYFMVKHSEFYLNIVYYQITVAPEVAHSKTCLLDTPGLQSLTSGWQ